MTAIARLLLPTCFLLVLIAFVQKFEAGPPPTMGAGPNVITVQCRVDAAEAAENGIDRCTVVEPAGPPMHIRNADGSICAWRGSYDDKIVICDPALSFSVTQSELRR